MKPNDKIAIVDYYESIDYVTVFCGDGANDTGALKHASVGISLSDLEASVASPFTSQSQSIECVATIIQEGRCALVTSFGIFKPSFQARILSNIPYDMITSYDAIYIPHAYNFGVHIISEIKSFKVLN